MELLVMMFWVIAVLCCLFNASSFALGHTYDYRTRRRTYHGTKTMFWAMVLVVMYYIPWQSWGIFA